MNLENLKILARLIEIRNQTEQDISSIIHRPAAIGHLGEFIASQIFDIALEQSASHKSSDGIFNSGLFEGKSVNIKWYAQQEGILDLTPDSYPDYYLVLSGNKTSGTVGSIQIRPWTIAKVYLFHAHSLVDELKRSGVRLGVATSVRQHSWQTAEIYPTGSNSLYALTQDQQQALALFHSTA